VALASALVVAVPVRELREVKLGAAVWRQELGAAARGLVQADAEGELTHEVDQVLLAFVYVRVRSEEQQLGITQW
jgi:hypothetical protein